MEVINGDYGDVLPKLAQAVLSGECDAFNDRYKMCLPKRCSFTSSSKSSMKDSALGDKKRVSSSCLSNASSNHSNGSCNGLMTSKNGIFQTDSSSKESSEEVSYVLI